jgi:lactate dehydrogenase-like 2-hydroxyacid dehydrogenase
LNLDKCKELDVLPCSKEDLIKNSDFLSIHVQGGERYKDCITLKELDKMKKTAFLINTSRGPIVNEDDLIIALSTNEIAGAGLDVFETEPNIPSQLKTLENVVSFPHLGSATIETRIAMGNTAIDNALAFFAGKDLPNKVV